MIVLKYTKTDGAQFLAHLDILRHIGRTMRRAGVKVALSQGYHPHMLVYLSAPMGLGITSLAEYCQIETDENPEVVLQKFNEFAPRGLRCVGAWKTQGKVGIASDIVKAEYLVKGINSFDTDEFLKRQEFIVIKKDGTEKNVRDLIYSVEWVGDTLKCVIGFGNGLRIEKFTENLIAEFGGGEIEVVKTRGLTADEKDFEDGLK
jgi:radical SAM-linked protein